MSTVYKKTYKVTLVTPVHIGSPGQWLRGVHFESLAQKTVIYHLESTPVKEPENSLFTGDELVLPAKSGQETQSAPLQVYPNKIYSNEISPFSKNAWGNPYIPGNSLKGFYHSSLLFRNKPHANPDDKTDRCDFSGLPLSPHIERVLFPDIEFSPSSLAVSDVKILNLTSDKTYGWKKYGKDQRSLPQAQTATSYYVETIKAGEFSLGEIKLKLAAKNGQMNPDELFIQLSTLLNSFSHEIVQKELSFYNNCSMNEGYQFYFGLNEKLRKLTSGFFACIGWGVGWQCMIGPLNSQRETDFIRQNYDLGKMDRPCPGCSQPLKVDKFKPDYLFCTACKKGFPVSSVVTQLFPVFPKSRKFVVEGNRPLYPLGWLRFEESPNYEKIRDDQTHTIKIQIRQKTTKVIRSAFLNPEEYPEGKSQTKHFKKKIKIQNRGNFPTEFNMFLNKLAELEFVISINGTDIDPTLETMQMFPTGSYDELTFHFSHQGKGIVLSIKTGAQNEAQYNFVVNRIWEIVDQIKNK